METDGSDICKMQYSINRSSQQFAFLKRWKNINNNAKKQSKMQTEITSPWNDLVDEWEVHIALCHGENAIKS